MVRRKTIEQQVKVSEGDRLVVDAALGDVRIRTWKKPMVSVRIVITGMGYTQGRVDSMLDGLDVQVKDHEHGSAKITVERPLPGNKDHGVRGELSIVKDFKDIDTNGKAISYELMIPDGMFVDVKAVHGDVHFEDDYSGPVNVDVFNGRLFAKKLMGRMNYISIDAPMFFDKWGHIGYLDNSYVNAVHYLQIDHAGDVHLRDGRGLKIGTIDNVYFGGNMSEVAIDRAGNVVGRLDKAENIAIGTIQGICELWLFSVNGISFTDLSAVRRMNISGYTSSIKLGQMGNAVIDINADVKNVPSYLQKGETGCSGTVGNGSASIGIHMSNGTVTFE
ncbi:hypothetical protein GCM10023093_01910 [Nemorincola caseinilytica]|uniref:Adhesin domain-containing protein n=2 Tax=Nemorincola caseinilytica TaxID=2054315 RepID=A0ABP8N237_9BACT